MANDSWCLPHLDLRHDVAYAAFKRLGNPLLPPLTLLTPQNLSPIPDDTTYLTIHFERVKRGKRRSEFSIRGSSTPFPTRERRLVVIETSPALIFPVSPNSLRRLAVLTPAPGAVNEVTFRPARVSPVGDDGVWLQSRTRIVPYTEAQGWASEG